MINIIKNHKYCFDVFGSFSRWDDPYTSCYLNMNFDYLSDRSRLVLMVTYDKCFYVSPIEL